MGNCCQHSDPSNEYDTNYRRSTRLKMSKEINKILDSMESETKISKIKNKIPKRNFEDNYETIKTLGSGLFSTVYLVKDNKDKRYAMKVIQKKNFRTRDHIQKILIEKEIMKNLNHRNILKLYKTFQTEQNIYFLMEYASKGTQKFEN